MKNNKSRSTCATIYYERRKRSQIKYILRMLFLARQITNQCYLGFLLWKGIRKSKIPLQKKFENQSYRYTKLFLVFKH